MVRGGHERGPGGQVVAVTGATTFAPVAVDGRLQFAGVAQLQLVALVGVQVLHVSGETERQGDEIMMMMMVTMMMIMIMMIMIMRRRRRKRIKFAGVAQLQPVALVREQVLHVSGETKIGGKT